MPDPRRQLPPSFVFGLEPKAAIAWFESKGYRISWNWQDTWQEAHARAFTVAKVTRLDVLNDIRSALQQSLKEGKTERWFEQQLRPVLEEKGWWGTRVVVDGQGAAQVVQLGSPQRLRTIFRANLQTAYMAGRWTDMVRNARGRPYWMYVAVMDSRVRPTHAAMNAKVYRWDDPIWDTHYPPCGFNCRCRIRALSESQMKRLKLVVSDSEGQLVDRTVDAGFDPRTGEVFKAEVTGVKLIGDRGQAITFFTDPGWNYNPGKASFVPDLNRYPTEVARQFVEGVVTGPEFERWFSIWQRSVADELKAKPDLKPRELGQALSRTGKSSMEYPVAVLRPADRATIGADSQAVLLSTQTLIEHLAAHPEIGLDQYRLLQQIVDRGEVYQEDDRRILLLSRAGKLYRASIKSDQAGKRIYLLSLFETSEKLADTQVRKVYRRLR